MVSPVFRAAGALTTIPGVGSGENVPVPAGATTGDALVMVYAGNGGSQVLSAATTTGNGWTLVNEVNDSIYGVDVSVWIRAGTGSEPATYPLECSAGGAIGSAQIFAWSGVDATMQDIASVLSTLDPGGGATSHTTAATTTATADTTRVHFIWDRQLVTTTHSVSSPLTMRGQKTTATCWAVADEALGAAGAYGGATITCTPAARNRTISLVLRGASGGGTILRQMMAHHGG